MMKVIDHGSGGNAECLHIVEQPIPKPKDGNVLIKVAYAGVNRPDILQRSGSYPPPADASPYLGLEVSGTIAAVGAGVTQWQVGDVVCALTPGGGYAEYCETEAQHCLPIPAGLSLKQAAALPETYMTVWTNVFERGRLKAGETLFVHGGSSGIGLTAIQLAKARGAHVIATVGNAEKVQACLDAGADFVINYKEQDFVEEVNAHTAGKGVDVILDMVGGDYIQKNIDLLALEGRLLQIAFLKSSHAKVNFMPIMLKRLTVTGSTLRARPSKEKAQIIQSLVSEVWPLLASGHCLPIIHSEYTFNNVVEAHQLMESSLHIGKIMLSVDKGQHV